MKPDIAPYKEFALCREMLETVDVVKRFDPKSTINHLGALRNKRLAFLTGEGSSRIFPAKRALKHGLATGFPVPLLTDGATQALEYDLSNCAVFGVSNSGKTKEVVRLFDRLSSTSGASRTAITTFGDSPLADSADKTYVLGCGAESAVAATKSVAEQALFYQALFAEYSGEHMNSLSEVGDMIAEALAVPLPEELIKAAVAADTIFFAGRNDGVAEELTLKTNEITRKKSDFLEGTYAVHGIEEVMSPSDVCILVDPFPEEIEKFSEVLVDGVGLTVVAISHQATRFPTIEIPSAPLYNEYIQLAAGWNVLVEIGLALSVDLDKPTRARKVGNEVTGP